MNGREVLADTLMGGGGTYDLSDVERVQPATGYAVGLRGGVDFPLGNLSDTRLEELAQAIILAVAGIRKGTASYIGTWIDGDRLYIDPVIIFRDKEVALGRALSEGQLAIYDFTTGESIETGARE